MLGRESEVTSLLAVAAALAWLSLPRVLVRLRRGLRNTSIAGLWMGLSILWLAWGLAGAISLTGGAPAGWVDIVWYSLAVTLLLPPIAVLGARRPIHRVWPLFVLLPLLLVFLWPVLSALARTRIPQAWSIESPLFVGYLVVLVMGAGNYLGLRQTIPALLWITTLLLLVGPLCPLTASVFLSPERSRLWATLTLAASGWGAVFQSRSSVPESSPAIDQMWLRFRDTFGLVWAMRVLERFNETARLKKWPLYLGLEGIEPANLPPPPKPEAALDPAALQDAETSLRWLLEKFVDEPWFGPLSEEPRQRHASLPLREEESEGLR